MAYRIIGMLLYLYLFLDFYAFYIVNYYCA